MSDDESILTLETSADGWSVGEFVDAVGESCFVVGSDVEGRLPLQIGKLIGPDQKVTISLTPELAAALVPILSIYAEYGRVNNQDMWARQAEAEAQSPKAMAILMSYLSNQWIPPDIKPAYEAMCRSLQMES